MADNITNPDVQSSLDTEIFDDNGKFGIRDKKTKIKINPPELPDVDMSHLLAPKSDGEPVIVDKAGNPKVNIDDYRPPSGIELNTPEQMEKIAAEEETKKRALPALAAGSALPAAGALMTAGGDIGKAANAYTAGVAATPGFIGGTVLPAMHAVAPYGIPIQAVGKTIYDYATKPELSSKLKDLFATDQSKARETSKGIGESLTENTLKPISVATNVGGDLLSAIRAALTGTGKFVGENIVKPVTETADTGLGAVKSVTSPILNSEIGKLLGKALSQTAYGPAANFASEALGGPSLFAGVGAGGDAYLSALDSQATGIINKPIISRSDSDKKFLETYPENRKAYLASLEQKKADELKLMEKTQKKAGAFGSLFEGVQYNDLAKVANYRTQMAALIDKQKQYLKELAESGSDDQAKSALEKLKSAQGQVSAFISQAAGQGAMSQSDKENLDRQNAQVSQMINDTIAAGASYGLGAQGGASSFYPVFTKLRGNLADAIASQQDFVSSSKGVFDRAADIFSPEPEQYLNFSGEKYISKLPLYNTPLADMKIDASKVEPKATRAELQQLEAAGKRTQEAKNLYPGKLGNIEGLPGLTPVDISLLTDPIDRDMYKALQAKERKGTLNPLDSQVMKNLKTKMETEKNFRELEKR